MSVSVVRNKVPARAFSAGAVLLLHVGLLLGLLWINFGQRPLPQVRERIIWLRVVTQAEAVKPPQSKVLRQTLRRVQQAAPSRHIQTPGVPSSELPNLPDQKGLSGLHSELFDCAPENLANLDEELRSQCQKSAGGLPRYDPNSLDFADRRSRLPGAQRWAAELARKNAPVHIPCTFVMLDATGKAPTPMINPFCAVAKAINGVKKEDFGDYAAPSQGHGN